MKEKAESSAACNHHRVGFLGLLVTLGIVFGDIGTSPLYVMKAILHTGESISESTILGALSCIIWTLTLQTTIKYVCVALRADNNGEGGILALYALLRRLKSKWIYLLAIIGASTLLADGIITPAITVTTAIEGLESISPNLPVIPITLAIITIIFFVQRFGTQNEVSLILERVDGIDDEVVLLHVEFIGSFCLIYFLIGCDVGIGVDFEQSVAQRLYLHFA
jgi:KUP system potassium uptake protein